MNRLIQLNKATAVLFVVLGLGCFWLSPLTHALNPPPDGGYPNANTAEGGGALDSLTTGGFNTATGWLALRANTTASANTADGAEALRDSTGDANTAIGSGALFSNTTGGNNTAIGANALRNNTTGNYNMASGVMALFSNTTNNFNTATGAGALLFNEAEENTATGAAALLHNTTGDSNTAAGSAALFSNTTGAHNTANGFQTLATSTTGDDNTALGFLAGSSQTTGSNNIYIGSFVLGLPGESNACYIASIFGQTSVNGVPVLINASNKLGTATSSARFKRDIHDMDKASEALFALRPVAFRYQKEIDPVGTSQFGLVAEDVEKVNPDLIVRDKDGKPYSVRYDQVNAMLLNEFLKEHRKLEEQRKHFEAALARQQKQIEALIATVNEQTTQIQKVSARLEMSGPAAQVVKNKD
jgi:Chaperone of endosialidase